MKQHKYGLVILGIFYATVIIERLLLCSSVDIAFEAQTGHVFDVIG